MAIIQLNEGPTTVAMEKRKRKALFRNHFRIIRKFLVLRNSQPKQLCLVRQSNVDSPPRAKRVSVRDTMSSGIVCE